MISEIEKRKYSIITLFRNIKANTVKKKKAEIIKYGCFTGVETVLERDQVGDW